MAEKCLSGETTRIECQETRRTHGVLKTRQNLSVSPYGLTTTATSAVLLSSLDSATTSGESALRPSRSLPAGGVVGHKRQAWQIMRAHAGGTNSGRFLVRASV